MEYMVELFNFSTNRYITCTPADTMFQVVRVYLRTLKMQELYRKMHENAETCVSVRKNGHYMPQNEMFEYIEHNIRLGGE